MLLATATVAACALASGDTASPPRWIFLSLLQQGSLKPDLAACVVPRAQVAPLTLPFAPRRSTFERRPPLATTASRSFGTAASCSISRARRQHLCEIRSTGLNGSLEYRQHCSPSRYPIHCLSAASSVTASTSNRERLDAQIFSRRLLLGYVSLFSRAGESAV